MDNLYAVEVKNACKLYPPDFTVLNGFNMKVPSGAMYVCILSFNIHI